MKSARLLHSYTHKTDLYNSLGLTATKFAMLMNLESPLQKAVFESFTFVSIIPNEQPELLRSEMEDWE